MNPNNKTLREIEQSGLSRAVDVGAYVKLLIHYSRNGSLPADGVQMRAIASVDEAEWPAVRKAIGRLFYREGDVIHPHVMRSQERTELGVSRDTMMKVIEKWIEILPELPEPVVISEDRYKSFCERWAEASKIKTSALPNGYDNEEDGLLWWSGLFNHIRKSDFLMGRKTEFRAHFDFILQRSSFRKLLEGVYHGRK